MGSLQNNQPIQQSDKVVKHLGHEIHISDYTMDSEINSIPVLGSGAS